MSSTYTKSIASDFGGSFSPRQFHDEIENDVTITTNLIGINTTGDAVDIIFSSALSGAEETQLNSLISSYSYQQMFETKNIVTVNPKVESVNTDSYRRIMVYIYPGNVYNTINNIKVVSYMDSGITSYDIQIRNATNGTTIVTKNLTNTTEQINDLGTLSNIPNSEARLEISVKKTGGNSSKYVYIESISFYLG